MATTLLYSAPIFVALGSGPLLKEKIGLPQILAILINLTGCFLVAEVYNLSALFQSPQGFLLGIGSGLSFGIYALLGKITGRKSQINTWSSLFYLFLFGFLFLAVWAGVQEGTAVLGTQMDLSGWVVLSALAFGPTLGGYILFTFSLNYLPAAVASLFTTLELPVASFLALILFGRVMAPVQWVGAIFIIGGVVGLQLNGLRVNLKKKRSG